MRILVISQYYKPEEFQINDIGKELVKRGHEVTVLTGLPNYPSGIVPKEYKGKAKRHEVIDGVHVIRCYEKGRKKGAVHLCLNYISFCMSASWKALWLKGTYDVIFIYQLSPVMMGIPGILLKKRMHLPALLYCCDIWPESIKTMLPGEGLLFRLVKHVSAYVYRGSDRIVVQSPSFLAYFQETFGIEQDDLEYIPQFADSEYLDMDFEEEHEGFHFVFLGNIGIAQNIDCIIRAADRIRSKSFLIHIVGDGTYLEKAKQLVKEYELEDHFIFYGRRPVEQMKQFYRLADVCLLTLKAENQTGLTIPSKLQGYMAAGMPVLAAIDGSAATIIQEANCGIRVPSGDDQRLAEEMAKMIEGEYDLHQFGKHAKAYFKQAFTCEKHITSLLASLETVIQDKQ